MRSIAFTITLLLAAAAAASAQQWEFGALGGGQFLSNVSASGSGVGSATAGFAPGAAAGVFLGNNLYHNFGGEIRYEFLQDDLRLSSGQSTTFGGQSHLIHYDVIYHTNRSESQAQFFAALGGGMRFFRGTGAEEAYQPLSQFGYFTKTNQIEPMLSVGGGLTYRLSTHIYLRAEIRDFITPFPKQVLTPAPGVKFGSILQDLVPMVGLSYVY